MNKTKSLKKEISLILTIFSILVIVVIGALSIFRQYQLQIEETKYDQDIALKQVEQEVEQLTSKIEFIADYISTNYKANTTILKDIVEINNNISSLLILDKKGIIEEFYALSNLNIYKGFDYSNKDYFKKLQEVDKYWSNVFLSTVDEEPSISYSFKMGEKIGVIMINLSGLSNFLEQFKNQDGSHMIRTFDKNGIMIINPDNRQMVLQRFNASSSEVFTKLINEVEPYNQIIFYSHKNLKQQFGQYTKIDRTGWSIVVRVDHEYILKSLYNILFSFITAILLLIIISIYVSLKISKNIFKSLDDMQSITSNIANGNYDDELRDLHYDEFNKLLNSFNKMQSEIDKREDNLENSLESFKSLFNSTMESIILTENGKIIDVNDVTVKLFGYKSKKFFIDRDITNFIAPEYAELLKSKLKVATDPYEVDILKSDGTKIQTLVQGKFLNFQGRKIRVSAIIDVTELKQKDELLFQQSKMAAMGEMIGNIAHQWRQPLNTISTCASGIKFEKEFNTLDDKRLVDTMDVIVDNTQFLSKTIDDFRNFFKSNQNAELFSIKESINQTLKLLDATLKNNEIKLVKNFLDSDFKYEGFSNEFIQVLINIINNSKDAFTANENKKKYIEIDEYIKNDKYVIEIKDNAGGIDEKYISRVFEPYFTTKHKSQGTGIGLYMSHQIIVDHMKGGLNVRNIEFNIENEKYKGASFSIELPIR